MLQEGWYHATLNLEDSVGVASQLGGVGSQQAATEVQRKWSQLWLNTGAGRLAEAVATCDEIAALEPKNQEVVYQRALLLARGGAERRAEALAGFKAAIKAAPRQAEPYNNWAGLLMAGMGQGGDDAKHARQAEAALRKATALNPTHANAWENWVSQVARCWGSGLHSSKSASNDRVRTGHSARRVRQGR